VNPSGKLPFVIPQDESQLPKVDFFKANEIHYDFDHGYRKLDREGNTPAYPFGFGLSYTKFAYGEACYLSGQCVMDEREGVELG